MPDVVSNKRTRLRILMLVTTGLIALFLVQRAMSADFPPGLLAAVAFAFIISGAFAAIIVGSDRRTRRNLGAGLLTLLFVIAVAMWPNYRRVVAVRELREIGATVTMATEPVHGLWFQWGYVYLPHWLRDILGDEFFDQIDQIETDRVDDLSKVIADVRFDETINTLTLREAEISPGQLKALSQIVDANSVRFLHSPFEASQLQELANIPSLDHIEVVHSGISEEDCQKFLVNHPTVNITHMDERHGHGWVRPPTGEQ